eukprot:UN25122
MEWGSVEPVCKQVLGYFVDKHPRVQWACINCVGQICTDHGPEFQKKFGKEILTGLVTLMKKNNNPRVQAHAAAALINFAEPCKPDLLEPYLDKLLRELAQLINSGYRNVKEQAITAVAGLAENAKQSFQKYYKEFVPTLFRIVRELTDEEMGDFRGRALEALTFVGLAVGKKHFLKDAKDIMKYTLQLISTITPDNGVYAFIIHSWARVADCIQEDFNEYLPHVLKIVLPHAQCEVTTREKPKKEYASEIIYEDEADNCVIYLDHHVLELKKHSVHLMAIIANFCEKEYLVKLMETFSSSVNFVWDSKVSQCAAMSLIAVIAAAKRGYGPKTKETAHIFHQCFNKLVAALLESSNEDIETPAIIVNCLKSLISEEPDLVHFTNSQKPESLPQLFESLLTAIECWGYEYESAEEQLTSKNTDEYAVEHYKIILQSYDVICKDISLVVGEIIRIFRDSSDVFVKDLVTNKFPVLWQKPQILYKRTVVYFISDFVEHLKPEAIQQVFPKLMDALYAAIENDNESIKQAAFNALGLIGSKGHPLYNERVDEICKNCIEGLKKNVKSTK